MLEEYIKIFIDPEYPNFIDKYLNTKTMKRLKHITQFCGCDYTKLYNPRFLYTRFDHSLVVAHMTWHFTHDKKETIVALLHDIGTPCFAHCIDFALNDSENQESSEKDITEMIKLDKELLSYLKEDNIKLKDFEHLEQYPILENKSPKLCTDRLDGVLHTCYIWLHTHTLEQIKFIYDNIVVFKNEEVQKEIGIVSKEIAEKFVEMVYNYAIELQGNTNKYVMKYIAELIKLALEKNLITMDDLYIKKEKEIIDVLKESFSSWESFANATSIIKTNDLPSNFYISIESKKRNTIPLISTANGYKRIIDISEYAKDIYQKIENYHDTKYAFITAIETLE